MAKINYFKLFAPLPTPGHFRETSGKVAFLVGDIPFLVGDISTACLAGFLVVDNFCMC